MSMISAYCTDSVTIVMSNGNDSWGEPISGTLLDVKGYIVWKTQLVRNQQGEEVQSACMVYLPWKITRAAYLNRELTHEDRLILGAEPFDRAIIDIRKPKDFSHPHYEIFLA
jgi:hypothetical protein